MNKIVPYIFLLLFCASAKGQVVFNTLNEDFNDACATLGPNYPASWTEYNVIEPRTLLAWNCAPLSGRNGSPGIGCSGFYGGRYFVDTAWLFTPLLNLRDVNDRIFLRYDSRYQFIAARFSVLLSYDFEAGRPPETGVDWMDITSSSSPVISQNDSVDWVTHWIDVTPYKDAPFYIAFRFISDTVSGGIWTIDNVMTTTHDVGVHNPAQESISLKVLGNSTSNAISLATTINHTGLYTISLYDNQGRRVHEEQKNMQEGAENVTLNNMGVKAGLYLVKIANEKGGYGLVKTIVQ